MDTYVARQPILDQKREVFAYELLFRSGPENLFRATDGDLASAKVISDGIHLFGLEALTGGKKIFVNTTRRVLTQQLIQLLPKEITVVELLETVTPDDDVVASCRALKKMGYSLALDDFVFQPGFEPLLEIADIVKVDFLQSKGAERRILTELVAGYGARLLAEKVETNEEFAEAVRLGYTLFQGYFFCKPEMIAARDVPAYKLNYLSLLQALSRPELDFDKLEQIIKREVSLSVKLLRFLNSATFGWRTKISSIKQALVLLGEQPFKKWASLMALGCIGDNKPPELLVMSLARARFLELLGTALGLTDQLLELFLTGLLSQIDVMMGRPLPELLEELSLPIAARDALLGTGGPLLPLFSVAMAYERGAWDEVSGAERELKLKEGRIPEIYREALDFAEKLFVTAAA